MRAVDGAVDLCGKSSIIVELERAFKIKLIIIFLTENTCLFWRTNVFSDQVEFGSNIIGIWHHRVQALQLEFGDIVSQIFTKIT